MENVLYLKRDILEASLEDFVEWDEEAEEKAQTDAPWEVKSDRDANWVFAKLVAAERQKERIEKLAEEEISRIKAWKEKEVRNVDLFKERMTQYLEAYYVKQRALDPSYALKTPNGSASYRKQPDEWAYDEEVLLPYLEAHDAYKRVRWEIDKKKIREEMTVVDGSVVDPNGEIVEGIRVAPRPPVFAVRLKK